MTAPASGPLATRSAGILLHPTSLPGRFGIGELGPEAHRWLERLAAMGQRLWQLLPLGPTGFGDSPYQTLSTFAGNPLLVSFDALRDDGLVDADRLDALPPMPADHVAFGDVIGARLALLHEVAAAFPRRASAALRDGFEQFVDEQGPWLEDYALFVSLKARFDGRAWTEWPADAAAREPGVLAAARRDLADGIHHARVGQFLFQEHWSRVRARAAALGISIIGDLPIFVAHDSADVWCRPDLFALAADGRPTVVAGVPPDYFSLTGQRWGNPLYRWDVHVAEGFAWWIARLRHAFALVDVLRIDHFRGFAASWEIPAADPTAEHGRWVPGPGRTLFDSATAALGPRPIIAEDLGVITPDVDALREELGFPGMRILQFAFGGEDRESHRPGRYPENTVVYTGTHDNDTTVGWYRAEPGRDTTRSAAELADERHRVRVALGSDGSEINWDMIALALGTPARTAVCPLQDVIGLGSEARMNVPGRAWGNWQWRFRWDDLRPEAEERLARLTRAASRGSP
ncbi:MAG: 4-alpha-glucanotransferase [Planctomycetaceae bacterium]